MRDIARAGASQDLELLKSRVTERSLMLIDLSDDLGKFKAVRAHRGEVEVVGVDYPMTDMAFVNAEFEGRLMRLPLRKEHGRWRLDLLLMGDMLMRSDTPILPSPVLR